MCRKSWFSGRKSPPPFRLPKNKCWPYPNKWIWPCTFSGHLPAFNLKVHFAESLKIQYNFYFFGLWRIFCPETEVRRKIPVTPRDQLASHPLSHRPNDRSDGQSRSTMKVANQFRPETDKLRPLDLGIFLRQEIDHIKVIH